MATVNQHDVFIDFSGRDTRYSFISHLSAAFHRRGISVLVAEVCAIGTTLTQYAVEEPKVFVVVFSENYAFSSWSLDMLVKFLERQRRRGDGLVVVPVFYGGATRLMVEQQTGRFKDAFTEHQKRYSEDVITRWRDGLIETASLPGHESSDQRIDSDLVEEIVADVREKLDPTGKIGVYSRLLEVENLICKQSHGVCRLGIWGMAGIGKTTIAQAAFEQMSPDFEIHCFIKDFQRELRNKGLYDLREEHLTSSSTKASPFADRLQHTKALIVLDDVRNPMDAETFLGGFDWFCPGSVIIIISRDKQVLYQCQVQDVYEVSSLNHKEALQLFTRCSVREDDTWDSNLLELSKKVVEYANGIPLALRMLGGELKNRTTKDMEATFQKIEQLSKQEILYKLRSSYDALSYNEKSIFLDIACFFKGEQLDHVMRILEGCGFFPHVGIDRLVERSLVMISENNKVEMHNLIQEVGQQIVKEEKNQIGRRRRLWETSVIRSLLANNKSKGTEVIEGIFLDTTNLKLVVEPMAFENMYNLRLLKIYSSSSETDQELFLPDGLHSLPYELRLLHWNNYPLRSLPQDFDPSHLVELNMPYSQLQKFWGGAKNLVNLKIINLSHSQKLVEVDELSKACSLEQIDLQGCTSLESIPHTGQLNNLQHLNLSGCPKIKREEVIEKIKGLDVEGGLRETGFESMVFSTLGKLELKDNTESL